MNYENCKKYIDDINEAIKQNKKICGYVSGIVVISLSNDSHYISFKVFNYNDFIVEFDNPNIIIKKFNNYGLGELENIIIIDTSYISSISVSFS